MQIYSKGNRLLILAVWIVLISSCTDNQRANTSFDYGTKNDSARHYFLKGWEEILDNGRWTESEIAFRKAVELDPNWPLGKSLVGRISRDLEERQKLLQELEAIKDQVGPDERKLLEVNMLILEAANNRDQGIKNTQEFNKNRMQLAETNFGDFARKYPDDDYFKAEYIEFLHANRGTQVALDSLNAMATSAQKQLGFYISYSASMELELGNLDKAIELSKILNKKMTDPSYTAPLMLQARILMAQDSLQKAKAYVDKVVEIDTNHIIALGMQSRINNSLEK